METPENPCPRCGQPLLDGWCAACARRRRVFLLILIGIGLPALGLGACANLDLFGEGAAGFFAIIGCASIAGGPIAAILYLLLDTGAPIPEGIPGARRCQKCGHVLAGDRCRRCERSRDTLVLLSLFLLVPGLGYAAGSEPDGLSPLGGAICAAGPILGIVYIVRSMLSRGN